MENIFMFIKENKTLHFREWNLLYLACWVAAGDGEEGREEGE